MSGSLTNLAALLGVALAAAGCGDRDGQGRAASTPEDPRLDEPPAVTNAELPFRYPPALYARRVQGNVMLRLFVDHDGRVVPDSTRVEESSGHDAMDSAAVRGSQELRFRPARQRGQAVGVSVLFPVYFRHPEAAPLPGDTVLLRRPADPTSRQP